MFLFLSPHYSLAGVARDPNHIFLKLEVSDQGLKGETTTQKGFQTLQDWEGKMSDLANQSGDFRGGLAENPANRLFKSITLQPVGEITMEHLLRRIEALETELALSKKENADLRVIVNRCYTLHGPPPPQ